jgi:hypothetical protein
MATTTTTTRTGTYQMLWDCPACGTRKLLGIDHRHCPNCGAPQEENLRYFPSKADRVATAFRGTTPDWECERCGTPNFSVAPDPGGDPGGFCSGCGAPRGGSQTVHVRASIPADASETGDQAAAEWKQRQAAKRVEQRAAHVSREPVPEPEPPPRSAVDQAKAKLLALLSWMRGAREQPKRLLVIGFGVALLAVLFLAACPRTVPVELVGHSWSRVIPVERYTTLTATDWCSSMPSDARENSRWTEFSHNEQIPDGEDCQTVAGSCSESCTNVDNGNGSFSEVCTQTCTADEVKCTTRYREEPVYADKCSYDYDRWVVVRKVEASGWDLEPRWPPEPSHDACGHAVGCERLGRREEVYKLHFITRDLGAGEEPEPLDCERSEAQWRTFEVGARFVGKVSRLTGNLNCDKLEPDTRAGGR